jgi:heme-degrading monooxygenase HmoA
MAPVAIAMTPEPPYYAAVITVQRNDYDDGYVDMADAMNELAKTQPGFLGMEWVYDPAQRAGITSSYWASDEAIAAWKQQADHLVAQRLGQERWYRAYTIRIARVERDYTWSALCVAGEGLAAVVGHHVRESGEDVDGRPARRAV